MTRKDGARILGDVVTVVDCEHRTAPRAEAGRLHGYSIRTTNIRQGAILLDDAKPVTYETFREWTRRAVPSPGDLILSREAPMGEVGAVPIGTPVCLGQRTVLLQLRHDLVDQRFLKHLLMSPASQQWILGTASGTTVLHLNVADVRRIPIGILPPLAEQLRTVSILEDHLSRLDDATRGLETVRRRADAWFASFRRWRLRQESGAEQSFQEVFEIVSDRGRRVDQRNYLATGRVPVVDQGESLVGGYTDDESLLVAAPGPLLVFGDHTRRVKFVDFPFAVGAQGVKLLKPAAGVHPRFAYWCLSDVRLPSRGYGRHFALLRSMTFHVPRSSRQGALADDLDLRYQQRRELLSACDLTLTRMRTLRKSLLIAAFARSLP